MNSIGAILLKIALSLAIISLAHALLYYFGARTKSVPKPPCEKEQVDSQPVAEASGPEVRPDSEAESPNQEIVAGELREYLRELRAREQRSKDNS